MGQDASQGGGHKNCIQNVEGETTQKIINDMKLGCKNGSSTGLCATVSFTVSSIKPLNPTTTV